MSTAEKLPFDRFDRPKNLINPRRSALIFIKNLTNAIALPAAAAAMPLRGAHAGGEQAGVAAERGGLAVELGCRGEHLVGALARTVDQFADACDAVRTSRVRAAAPSTLSAILRAAIFCCSTESEMAREIALTWCIDVTIASLAWRTTSIAWPTDWVLWRISAKALVVCAASALTSWATTAKPRPASPARAASMVALSASRLVCPAIAVISAAT